MDVVTEYRDLTGRFVNEALKPHPICTPCLKKQVASKGWAAVCREI